MKRCFDLAKMGSGRVAPNPMVGAVIVYKNRIIGEGYHRSFGGAHAEVEAVNSVTEEDKKLLPLSDVYVNLEPCSHEGKTPPCCELLIAKKIKNIFISNTDPNPLVQGNGIRKLQQAGCRVQTGLLKEEGDELNKRFFTFHQKQRPYIILKWAQTRDGYFTKNTNEKHWITGEISKRLTHKWRTEEMAIMAGMNTIRIDNPELTARYWPGKNPIRIVIDRELQLSQEMHVFNDLATTYIFHAKTTQANGANQYISVPFDDSLLDHMLAILYNRQVSSVMVEGGARLLQSFIKRGRWDEARILTGYVYFGEGVRAPEIQGELMSEGQVGEDILTVFKNKG